MNATHRSPLKLVKKSMVLNNAKEQICNQFTSRLSRHLWFTYESGGIFPTSSAVARSRFLAGVAITNISMQLALLYNEPDYLTYNPTSRHGTGYTYAWPPAYSWARVIMNPNPEPHVLNSSPPSAAYVHVSELGQHWFRYWLVASSAPSHYQNQCCLIVKLDSCEHISVKFKSEFYHFHSRKCIWKCRLSEWRPFCPRWRWVKFQIRAPSQYKDRLIYVWRFPC